MTWYVKYRRSNKEKMKHKKGLSKQELLNIIGQEILDNPKLTIKIEREK